jgi:glycosyltransferase involved in cell wall biosynthesis
MEKISRIKSAGSKAETLVVSVIIPHYNDPENLRLCLACLSDQSLPRERYEIVVADNNSACGIEKVMSVCAGTARVIAEPMPGSAIARNAAVRNTSAPYLAFIDQDCLPSRDWLAQGIEALSDSDMVGGQIEVIVVDPEFPTPVEAFELVFSFNNRKYITVKHFSTTANMFVRRKVFEAVGDFRPNVAEDVDWGNRAVALGYRWKFEPRVKIKHPARYSWDDLLRKWRRDIKSRVFEARHKPFGVPFFILRSWVVAISPLFHTTKVLMSPKLKGIDQKLGALAVLYRLRIWRFIEAHRELLKSDGG